MTAAAVEAKYPPTLKCAECGHNVAMWDADAEEWQPLGARFKRLRDENRSGSTWRPMFVCPICGKPRRIPGRPDTHA